MQMIEALRTNNQNHIMIPSSIVSYNPEVIYCDTIEHLPNNAKTGQLCLVEEERAMYIMYKAR